MPASVKIFERFSTENQLGAIEREGDACMARQESQLCRDIELRMHETHLFRDMRWSCWLGRQLA